MGDLSEALTPASAGFFGKLPTHGDFVSRGVPGRFREAWDAWLAESLVESRSMLGEAWLGRYLQGPIWRFVLSEGVIGDAVWAGVMMPSVDRVGRYFPLTLVGQWPPGVSALRLADDGASWFDGLESLALTALEARALDLDAYYQRIVTLPAVAGRPRPLVDPVSWVGTIAQGEALGTAWVTQLEAQARAALGPLSLWWWRGETRHHGSWQAHSSLPDATGFAALLASPPEAVPGEAAPVEEAVPRLDETLPRMVTEAPGYRRCEPSSAGITHVGHQREQNQDAFLEAGSLGCWVVADGMGGHEHGELASAAVIDAIRNRLNAKASSLETRRTLTREALTLANTTVWRDLGGGSAEALAGSTVVALLIEGSHAVVLWAGDSRLYRWRAGTASFELLTHDHVEEDDPNRPAGEITRAVGAAEMLEVEEQCLTVEPGDRFLLCSDGVHGVIAEEALATLLGWADSPQQACEAITRAVLAGAAPDNLTAVVVFVA